MDLIDTLSYNVILNDYFTDLFRDTKSHYCDMLIVDVDQLSVLRPSTNISFVDIYRLLSLDRNMEPSMLDNIDVIVLETIIDYCMSCNNVSVSSIESVLNEISNQINHKWRVPSYFDHEFNQDNLDIDMALLKYFLAIKSTLNTVVSYQTRSFEQGRRFDPNDDDIPSRFYVYNSTKVYFTETVSSITLTIRFYRKA
jgi:hypothetical protein